MHKIRRGILITALIVLLLASTFSLLVNMLILNPGLSNATLNSIRATGADIISYFIVEGQAPWLMAEQAANNLILFAIVLVIGLLVWEYIALQGRSKTPPSDSLPDEVEQAEDSVEETERYMQRMERLSKKVLKDEDKDD